MSTLSLNRLLEFLTSIKLEMATLWLGLAAFTIGLAILMYTRWGQYKPLRKCMAMSLLAHLILGSYAATIEIVTNTPRPIDQTIHVSLGDGPDDQATPGGAGPLLANASDQPWETFPSDGVAQPKETKLERGSVEQPPAAQRLVRTEGLSLRGDPTVDHVALTEVKLVEPSAIAVSIRRTLSSESAAEIDAPAAERRDAMQPVVRDPAGPPRIVDDASALPARVASAGSPDALLEQMVPLPKMTESAAAAPGVYQPGVVPVPDAYRLRVAPNRAGITQSHGGTSETEAAVKAGLKWLADNQSADGRWDPRVHGAGKETGVLGRNHQGAGSHADTAMTGLALLAFLGSGHTHLEGPYRADVRRGLEYLIQTQAPDGNLGGQAAMFEFMYCHAMATCALSEAYGMTHDQRLREPVRRAIRYTLAAQDPKGGGWRYRPGEAGDTSQLGWQLMSLRSAELAGFPISEQTRQGVVRYLQSVSSGTHGGHASYRPGEQISRPMTAEALVCWQFLGLAREHPACNEAGDFVCKELPGEGEYNLYYWYYATLGMYQLQGDHWERWNEALRTALVDRQVKEGSQAGSWDTTDLWGGHGGRVYTTALATLTLEVYYRFLPLYIGVASGQKPHEVK